MCVRKKKSIKGPETLDNEVNILKMTLTKEETLKIIVEATANPRELDDP